MKRILRVIGFYLLVLKVSLKPSFGIAEGIGFIVGIVIPIVLHFIPKMESTLDNLAWQIPLGIFGSIFAVRLVLSPYWVYEDSRKKAAVKLLELQTNVTRNEWEYRRQHLIKTREPKLELLPKQLRDLLGQVDEVVNNLSLDDCDKKQIGEAIEAIEAQKTKYMLSDLLSDQLQAIINYCLNEHGINLENEIRTNKECYRLLDEISNCMDIGDSELTTKIKIYFSSLFNGYAVIFLLDNSPEFANRYGDAIKIRAIIRVIRSSMETKLTQVNKRVEELCIGDEAK
jgi:hypothetical protein